MDNTLTLVKVKNYLRVDSTDDDELITSLISFSTEYLQGAGIEEVDSETYRLAQRIIIDDRYNHRGSEEVTSKAKSSLNSIILQLQNAEVVL